MSTRFVQPGGTLTMVLAANVLSGQIVQKGALIGLAEYSAPAGAEVEVKLWGVHRVPKDGSTFAQGDLCYYADGPIGGKATSDDNEGEAPLLGVAARDAGSDAPEVDVLLTGGRNI